VAARALPCFEMVFENVVPGTADEKFVAVGAVGVGGTAVDIAFVDVAKAGFEGNLASAVKRFGWSGRLVLQLKIRMECGEVEGDIRAKMGEDPVSEFASFGGIIVECGNHEIGNFEPDVGFVFQPEQGVENRLKMGQSDLSVEIFGEGFEVDVGGIDVIVDVVEGFAGDVAVANHDGFQAERLSGFANVDDVLAPNCGFVVGERQRGAIILSGKKGNIFRREMAGIDLITVGFGDVPILTEETAHVATGGAHAEDSGAGKEMVEGLFLDGINLESGGRSVTESVELAVLIGTDVAEAGLAMTDVAVAGTEITVDAIVGFGFPPKRLVKVWGGLEDLEGRHNYGPRD
jgi:hypothetical protein